MLKGLDVVLKTFAIVPHNISLYEEAFTHASYTNEHPQEKDYDRLEFLGDSILDMVIADMLYAFYPDANSGVLTKMRAVLVEGKTLTDFSENRFGFSSLVRYSVGEKANGKFHTHIDEDVFEAFIGACYLDQGYLATRKILSDIYTPLLSKAKAYAEKADSKSLLQEYLGGVTIDYVTVSILNQNTDNVRFIVEARLGTAVLGRGEGHNSKEAETNAAFDALQKKVGHAHGTD